MSVTVGHPTNQLNFTTVTLNHGVEGPSLHVWFSYATPIAFRLGGDGSIVARDNVWGRTTGKHLNYVDDGNKADRFPGRDFEYFLAEAYDEAFTSGWPT